MTEASDAVSANATAADVIPKHNTLARLFTRESGVLIGMLHLLPLPGAPRYDPRDGVAAAVSRAISEAHQLEDAGFDGFIVENAWDIPFVKPDEVGHETTAALAVVVNELRREFPEIPIGINCLANAVEVSIAVAAATGGTFVRANQWVNAYVANEGFIEGRAGAVARYRHSIGADDVAVWADVQVKLGAHAITADRSITEQAKDAAWFDADALIVTGSRLGDPPDNTDLELISQATALPVVVGSGVRVDNLAGILGSADAVIVGTSIKRGGIWHGEMDDRILASMAIERDRATTGAAKG
jgi:membrane complex biogenesis BtpA family protein